MSHENYAYLSAVTTTAKDRLSSDSYLSSYEHGLEGLSDLDLGRGPEHHDAQGILSPETQLSTPFTVQDPSMSASEEFDLPPQFEQGAQAPLQTSLTPGAGGHDLLCSSCSRKLRRDHGQG
jgi:hypothetical protein